MKITPPKGMNDYLPQQTLLRDFIQGKILETYRAAGFERIYTPMIEDLENLTKSEGGDNLNLIFKVLKRGEKLEKALAAGDGTELADMGLRYDLTLPLSRYYAANRDKLPTPFKVIQTDRVYRAERPQKGRYREFVQCDIDILGDESPNAEVELIDTTARALLAIGFSDFTVAINDRRLLRAMLAGFGFAPDRLDSVCITFDKLDKIGADAVAQELAGKGFDPAAVDALAAFLSKRTFTLEDAASACGPEGKALAGGLRYVIDTVQAAADGRYEIRFTPNLVRGQGYYTGMVFEIFCPAFGGAVGGGGRYDNMIGKFLGKPVPAVGFSIGFERICAILAEQGYRPPAQRPRCGLLYTSEDDFAAVLQAAARLRETYDVTVLAAGKKPGKQLDRLEQSGYSAACLFAQYPQVKQLNPAPQTGGRSK